LDRFREVAIWVSLFIRRVTRRVGADFRVRVSGSGPRVAGEKCTCSHRFFAVGFGWGFLWCSEPNQAETPPLEREYHRPHTGD
jgi:hypothetical protein